MRRVVAIVLPQLACEIVRRRPSAGGPLGVILAPDGASSGRAIETAVLDVVSDDARRYGVRPGQRVTEAAALHAGLAVHRVSYGELDAALGQVAEVALAFGPTAALRLREAGPEEHAPRTPWGDEPFDTVWLDVTGAAHLAGGEEPLLAELEERIGALGHRARLAIAGGPRIAQALARWAPGLSGAPGARAAGRWVIAAEAPEGDARALAPLPVQALPLEPDTVSFLVRIGVFTVGDLARLPRPKAAARLGTRAAEVLALTAGRDEAPLVPYAPPREIVEETIFEEGVETTEALLFSLRGMASRAALRLAARGEACTRLEVELPLDRSIAALRLAELQEGEEGGEGGESRAPEAAGVGERIGFHLDLPAPLAAEGDLLRALKAKLDRTKLFAPAVGVRLRVAQIVPAPHVQLDLSRARAADPDSLPALLAELSAEIGEGRVGLLAIEDAHRPEASSRLVPVTLGAGPRRKSPRREQLTLPGAWSHPKDPVPPPARLLPAPIPLGKVTRGGVVAIGDSPKGLAAGGEPHLFAIEKLTHLMRLDGVEWWTKAPASRDYARAWLASGAPDAAASGKGARGKGATRAACAEALVYVVKKTGEMYLQGWYE